MVILINNITRHRLGGGAGNNKPNPYEGLLKHNPKDPGVESRN